MTEKKQNMICEEPFYDLGNEPKTNKDTYAEYDDFHYCSDPYAAAYRSFTPRQMPSLEKIIEKMLTDKLSKLNETASASTPVYKGEDELKFNTLLEDQQTKGSCLAGSSLNNYNKLKKNHSKLNQTIETVTENGFNQKNNQTANPTICSKYSQKMCQKSIKKVNKIQEQDKFSEVKKKVPNLYFVDTNKAYMENLLEHNDINADSPDRQYCSQPNNVSYCPASSRETISLEKVIDDIITTKIETLTEMEKVWSPLKETASDIIYDNRKEIKEADHTHLAQGSLNQEQHDIEKNYLATANAINCEELQIKNTGIRGQPKQKIPLPTPRKNRQVFDKKDDQANGLEEAVKVKSRTFDEAMYEDVDADHTHLAQGSLNQEQRDIDKNYLATANAINCEELQIKNTGIHGKPKQKRPLPTPRNNRQVFYKKDDQANGLEEAATVKSSSFDEAIYEDIGLVCLNSGYHQFPQNEEDIYIDNMNLLKKVPVNKDVSHSKEEMSQTCKLQEDGSMNWLGSAKDNLLKKTLAENEFLKSKIDKAIGELKKKATLSYFPDESEVNLSILSFFNTIFCYSDALIDAALKLDAYISRLFLQKLLRFDNTNYYLW